MSTIEWVILIAVAWSAVCNTITLIMLNRN